MRLVVPVKYSSTSSSDRPMASNTWAPVYEATVEMPIFDMIFSTPLVLALTKFFTAWRLVMPGDHALVDQVLDRLEGEVRVDGAGAVAEQQRHVVHLAGVAALDDEADLRAGLLADQVVVHGGGEQQRRDRGQLVGRVAVARG